MRKIDIPLFKVRMSEDAVKHIGDILNSGYIGEGFKVKEYELALKNYFKVRENYDIITCNAATSAEHLLYHMLKKPRVFNSYYEHGLTTEYWPGLNSTSEVISTPLTCTATNWPILHNGLKLIWADIDPLTMNISLEDIERKINENTRIIQVVHWGGYPVDLDKLNKIVSAAKQKYGTEILIVEDCAHAFGSKYKGDYVGFTGNFGTFSTQAIKHLTTIDGGFLTNPYREFAKACRLVRWYGIDREQERTDFRCEQDIPEIGFKFHMNDVNAFVGLANLRNIDDAIGVHRANAEYYNNKLKDIVGMQLLENSSNVESAYWLYTIRVDNRVGFMRMMQEAGIQTSRVHERNDLHSALDSYNVPDQHLPNLDMVCKDMVCIPVGWWVTPEDREYIVECIEGGW